MPDQEVPEATLREVIDYLDTHAHRRVRIAEIAGLAGVPAREVIEALRRHHDTSPARLARAARLRGVHRELLDADPLTGPTVAAVAVP
jgi:transcriptional regulator GlxA family with amidase domain